MGNVKIGYFAVKKLKDSYIGGVLVIDELGIPVDFKYTEPIVPSSLQVALYGKSIESYLKDKLIAKSLFKEINYSLSVCFSEIADVRVLVPFVKIGIGIATTMLSVELAIGEYNQIKTNEYLMSLKGMKHPVRLIFQDIPPSKIHNGLELIKGVSGNFSIIEPFSRLKNAFEIICSE